MNPPVPAAAVPAAAVPGVPPPAPVLNEEKIRTLQLVLLAIENLCAAFASYRSDFLASLPPETKALMAVNQVASCATLVKALTSTAINGLLMAIDHPPRELVNRVHASEQNLQTTFQAFLQANGEIASVIKPRSPSSEKRL